MKFADIKNILQSTVQEWGADKASRLAAALSYYTIFALPPLLLLLIGIASLVYGNAQAQVSDVITQQVGENAASVITTLLQQGDQPNALTLSGIVSLATLLFAASGLFLQLEDAMNTIWDVERQSTGIIGMLKKRTGGITMVLGIGFLLLVLLAFSAILSGLSQTVTDVLPGSALLYQALNFVISFGIVTLLFALLFKFVPDVEIRWRDVWLGAALTALLFTVGKWALGKYIGSSAVTNAYGAAGSLIALLLWIYYSAQILFFGAEFTQVYTRYRGRQIQPASDAVALSPQKRAQQGMSPKRKQT